MTPRSFKLDVFEGPLDLLLTLIKEHKLNIYDIEITLLLDQYMEYINNAEYEDYEEASDFLEMAARLIYIKTCSLLPHDEEAQQLKKELEGRLIEYSMCKSAAQSLKKHFAGGEIFVREPVKLPVNKEYSRIHQVEELFRAYMGLSAKSRKAKPLRASVFQPIVSKKIVSVTSKIIYVLKRLYKSGEFDMSGLYDGMTEKSEQVATFLAVLELTKSGRIYLNDDNSKIFFNKESIDKRKKNHHKEEENFSADTETTEITEETENVENENAENTPDEENVGAFNDITNVTNVTNVTQETETEEEISVDNEDNFVNDRENSEFEEYPAAVEASAVITEIKENVTNVKPVISVTPVAYITPEKTELSEHIVHNRYKSENAEMNKTINSEKIITVDLPPVRCAESEEIEEEELMLLKDVFKGNFWGKTQYYWGNSPTGAYGERNYWKYGNTRII